MYQGIFDTDFDKYTEDASPSSERRVKSAFEDLEGWPEDWKTNFQHSLSFFANTSARASSNTASIRM